MSFFCLTAQSQNMSPPGFDWGVGGGGGCGGGTGSIPITVRLPQRVARADGTLDGALISQEGREQRDTKDFLLGKKSVCCQTATLRSLFTKLRKKVLTTEEVNKEEEKNPQCLTSRPKTEKTKATKTVSLLYFPAATHHLFSVKLSRP